jgi:hypothetical protein
LAADGEPVEALDSKPELYDDLMVNWDVFWLLSSKRTAGFDMPNPISMQEIEACIRTFEITDWSSRMRLIQQIGIMDRAYLNYVSEQRLKPVSKGTPHG